MAEIIRVDPEASLPTRRATRARDVDARIVLTIEAGTSAELPAISVKRQS